MKECDEFENEDLLNNHRTPANETLSVPEMPNVLIDDENAILAPGR